MYIERFEWTATFEKEFLGKIVLGEECRKMSRDQIFVFDMLQELK